MCIYVYVYINYLKKTFIYLLIKPEYRLSLVSPAATDRPVPRPV